MARDHRLIDPKRLAELEERAQDGVDVRAALQSMKAKHYEMMEQARKTKSDPPVMSPRGYEYARGWLDFETEFGDSLALIARRRTGTTTQQDPADPDEAPF